MVNAASVGKDKFSAAWAKLGPGSFDEHPAPLFKADKISGAWILIAWSRFCRIRDKPQITSNNNK